MRWNHWSRVALDGFDWCVLWDPTFMLGIWHVDDWLKKYLAQPCLRSGGSWKSQTWFALASLIWGYFSLLIHEYYIGLYVDYMAIVSLVFLLLLCWLWTCIMIVAMYGSHHVFAWLCMALMASMLLSNSQISMRPLFSVLLLRLVAFMFVTCLTKFLSWLVGVQYCPCWCFWKCIFFSTAKFHF